LSCSGDDDIRKIRQALHRDATVEFQVENGTIKEGVLLVQKQKHFFDKQHIATQGDKINHEFVDGIVLYQRSPSRLYAEGLGASKPAPMWNHITLMVRIQGWSCVSFCSLFS
jgi:hypothetical protein